MSRYETLYAVTDRSGRGSGAARRAVRCARPDSAWSDSCVDARVDDFRRGRSRPDPGRPPRALPDPAVRDDAHARGPRPDRDHLGAVGRFVAGYGWRAYALPVLTVVTLVVLVDAVREPGANVAVPAGAALPDGGRFAVLGRGQWHVVGGGAPQVGASAAPVFTYTVEVEDGVDTADVGGDQAFAEMVDRTLAAPESWTADRRFAFRRVDRGMPDFRVSLTSQRTTRRVCGFDIPVDTSCFSRDLGRAVLDEARWVRGALPFRGDLDSYRQYMVNHEVGQAIGYHRPVLCPTDGGPASVMMEQTFGAAADTARLDPAGGKVCHVNPWPYPRA
jgi:hypothetical protein